MEVDIVSWLSLVTRGSVTTAAATVTVTEPDGSTRQVSKHQLQATDLLHWVYTVRDGEREVRHICDGRELVRPTGRHPTRSAVPAVPSLDDPWYFYSWPGVVDTWLVEMLRPVDLLARIVVSSISDTSTKSLVCIDAVPMGNEPSPYSGFSIPDGRSLKLFLDVDHGCLAEVMAQHSDGVEYTYRLTQLP